MHHACYGVETENGVITEAAPIAEWAMGRSIEVLIDMVLRRGGTVLVFPEICLACGFPRHRGDGPCLESFETGCWR